MSTVEEKVIKVLSEQLGVSKELITGNSDIIDDLGADSLDMVESIMALEEEFNCLIETEAADQIRTVDDFVKWLTENKDIS